MSERVLLAALAIVLAVIGMALITIHSSGWVAFGIFLISWGDNICGKLNNS